MRQKGGFISILLIFIIIAVIVGLLILLFIKKGGFTFENSNQAEENIIPDNWLTYENPTYFYKIKYEPSFHAQGPNEPPHPPPPAGMSFTKNWDNGEYCDFTMLSSTRDFFGELKSLQEDEKYTETETKIDNQKALYFDYQGGEALNRSYYLYHKGIYYIFGYNYKVAAKYSQDCADIVSKMVSSFELTNK